MKKRDESIRVHDAVHKGNNQLLWLETGQKQSLIEGRMLHEEVLVEILSKLPAKSVIRFTCVSKGWFALTKSSYFIARHLHRSRSANNPCSLLVLGISTEKYNYNKTLAVSLLADEETTLLNLDVSFPNYTSLRWRKLMLPPSKWNPATKQFRYLPEPIPLPLEEEGRRRPQHIWGCCENYPLIGFDFMQEINQYKELPSCKTCITCFATTSNGVFHWLVQQIGACTVFCRSAYMVRFSNVRPPPKELCCPEDGHEYAYRIPLFSWNNSAAILASLHQMENISSKPSG